MTNYEANWKKEGIELVKGLASFDDAQTVRVKLNAGGEQIIKASKVLVAVGGRPASPEDVPGIDLAINSDGFFDLEQQPQKVGWGEPFQEDQIGSHFLLKLSDFPHFLIF